MTDKRKEYIKNFIIRAVEGKVKQSEIEKIWENLLSYSREEWRDLKIIGQELAKEIIDEKISELPNDVSSDWKSIFQDSSHSIVNLFFAVFNEEVWYQIILLEKQTGLTKEQKIIKILPVISREMDKVAARGSSLKLSKDDYHKAEVKVVKKIKKVISEGKWIYFQETAGKELSKAEWMEKAREFIKILESLTVEEMVVLKEKIKLFANKFIDNYAPSQIKNSFEIRQFINSFMNLCCAAGDERSCKDFVDLMAKVGKLALQNPQLVARKNPLSLTQAVGTERELQNLMRKFAQHINKMASEGKQNNTLPTGKEESIIQKLTENTPHQEPIEGGNTSLGEILSDNLLTQSLTSVSSNNSSSKEPTMENLLKDFEETFGKTQSQGKWYKNPWVIGGFVVVAFLAGGLVFWLFSRKKKEQAKKKVNW